ncbi:MAG: TetR/AcrR family transcriptional regulator, partial [Rhodococcus sp.]|nr:TetR/AcrR family transcriptional regulator [Rhodococcus sp. (in: high G+C Gram-positive bacteria)]
DDESALVTAKALLVLGAGAALFTSLIAEEDDSPELRGEILSLLVSSLPEVD